MMKDMYILVDRIKNDPTFLEKIKKTYHELLIKHPSLLQNSLLKIADKQQLFNNTKSSPLYTKYETCALFCYVSIDRVDCLILLFLLILLALSYAIPMAIQRLIQLLGTVIKIIIDQIFPTLTVSNLTKLLKN
ncbi:MAG: hypothetical protein KKG04_01900 [Candidatus Thermoplasmatota archaeon]|nr:hypothetical protein [Candidatus Thermoplasmatota archaeon]